jgi:hypothetical protein
MDSSLFSDGNDRILSGFQRALLSDVRHIFQTYIPEIERTMTEPTTYVVDPSRLAFGVWDHTTGREHGEGEIVASYSGDTIGAEGKVRKPFKFDGDLWVTVCLSGEKAEAYRLVPLQFFNEKPISYHDKIEIENGDAARADPLGFYNAMSVVYGRQSYVMKGPPVVFVAGDPQRPEAKPQQQQMEMFQL